MRDRSILLRKGRRCARQRLRTHPPRVAFSVRRPTLSEQRSIGSVVGRPSVRVDLRGTSNLTPVGSSVDSSRSRVFPSVSSTQTHPSRDATNEAMDHSSAYRIEVWQCRTSSSTDLSNASIIVIGSRCPLPDVGNERPLSLPTSNHYGGTRPAISDDAERISPSARIEPPPSGVPFFVGRRLPQQLGLAVVCPRRCTRAALINDSRRTTRMAVVVDVAVHHHDVRNQLLCVSYPYRVAAPVGSVI